VASTKKLVPCVKIILMKLLKRITTDPQVSHGKPAIQGLRYPVESILEYLAEGDTIEDILTEIKDLDRDDMLACITYEAFAIKT